MTVTKTYFHTLHYKRGIAEYTDERPLGRLWQLVFKATCIPGHRIDIKTHDDPADPGDIGAAMLRLEALRCHLVAESVEEQRLEMRAHTGDCCKEIPADLARRADIRLFPRVASLFPDAGDRLLSYGEVDILESARDATFGDVNAKCEELECLYTEVEWKRIIGHESLRKWIEAGSYHPFFESAGLGTGQYALIDMGQRLARVFAEATKDGDA